MATLDASVISKYGNKDQHVDTSIAGNDFTNSARTLIYVALHGATNKEFKPIGVVQGWSFTEQKQVEELFELGSDIRYIIPGRTTGQIAITRMLINGKDLLNTLYGITADDTAIKSLKDINSAVDLMFVTYHNSNTGSSADQAHMVRYFDNCWIVARQESITANQVVIAENCTVTYEKVAVLTVRAGDGTLLLDSEKEL